MDWTKLIADLREVGMTQAEIASELKCSQSTVSELARNERYEPTYRLGRALEALHGKRTRKPQAKRAVATDRREISGVGAEARETAIGTVVIDKREA